MRITIAAVGRLKDGAERNLVDRYLKRSTQGRGIGLGPFTEAETSESRRTTAAERMAEEGARLLLLADDPDVLVALAVEGRQLSSPAFAAWLAGQRDAGARRIAFVIGGADGLDATVGKAAALSLSLGPMTLPHGLARAVLAEQLYRAITILSGHPYHRA